MKGHGPYASDAKILAFRAPADGVYRIEARSHLDDHAGKYTLILNSFGQKTVDLEILERYVGNYLEGPWQFHVNVYIQDGQLYSFVEEMQLDIMLIPISETEFIQPSEGSTLMVFTQGDTGQVDGYNLYVSTINTVNAGKWFRAEKTE